MVTPSVTQNKKKYFAVYMTNFCSAVAGIIQGTRDSVIFINGKENVWLDKEVCLDCCCEVQQCICTYGLPICLVTLVGVL